MRTIGFVGLGKLGLPVALATETVRGFDVIGVDPDPRVAQTLRTRRLPYLEEGAGDLLLRSRIRLVDMDELARTADLIFVAVQTPHEARFEGDMPLVDDRADFDYSYVRDAIKALDAAIQYPPTSEVEQVAARISSAMRETSTPWHVPAVAIISTMLPGTFEREIVPLVDERLPLVYNPFFIAMGTTIHDFLNPEFVLVGRPRRESAYELASRRLGQFYRHFHQKPLVEMDATSAELTKVAYNAAIGQKIVLANALMEIAHKIGANVDDVTNALALATDRLVSPRYTSGGMGDGGGCHPRDNIALSWLARELDLSYDLFGSVMEARQAQTQWLSRVVSNYSHQKRVVMLGKSYKPGTNLTIGSPATLLLYYLLEAHRHRGVDAYDPWVDEGEPPIETPACFVIATKHPEFASYRYPAGSVVIDPFRYVEDQEGVQIVRVGEGWGESWTTT